MLTATKEFAVSFLSPLSPYAKNVGILRELTLATFPMTLRSFSGHHFDVYPHKLALR